MDDRHQGFSEGEASSQKGATDHIRDRPRGPVQDCVSKYGQGRRIPSESCTHFIVAGMCPQACIDMSDAVGANDWPQADMLSFEPSH